MPDGYAFPGTPVRLDGPVIHGFGRGSKQLGVPTANLPPDGFATNLPNGVYFGYDRSPLKLHARILQHSSVDQSILLIRNYPCRFARVDAPPEAPAEDSAVHPMVLNVGRRPTFHGSGESDVSIEANIQHSFAQDFYGCQMKVVVLGFLRYPGLICYV